jgi:hypothetical protein
VDPDRAVGLEAPLLGPRLYRFMPAGTSIH